MTIRLYRTFHPIGQGAFYSERFISKRGEKFNIVYDCGAGTQTINKSSKTQKVINNAFNTNEEIDILFISHFDNDHVNGIKLLIDRVKKINTVVLPFLEESEKLFLITLFNILGHHDARDILKDTEAFFGKKVKIVWVKPTENNERQIPRDNEENPISIKDLKENQEIDSGTEITFTSSTSPNIPASDFWIYQVYNYKFPERSKQFEEELTKHNINKTDLLDPDFISNLTKDNRTKIQAAYKKVKGDINENSMLVYSGPSSRIEDSINDINVLHTPTNSTYPHLLWHNRTRYIHHYGNRTGCLYTGDANLPTIRSDFLAKLKAKLSKIGVVQVAHHGAGKDFDIDFFNEIGDRYPLFCPISFGSNNSYGHPSSRVIYELFCDQYIPICVDETPSSIFIQLFRINL